MKRGLSTPSVLRWSLGNLVAAILPLAAWVLVDYLWIRGGQDPESALLHWSLGLLIFGSVPLGLGWANWPWCRRALPQGAALLLGLSVIAGSLLWFFAAFTIFMNVHFALGGSH